MKTEADPRLIPLTKQMVEAYESLHGSKYHHSGAKDGMALKLLLRSHTPEEILAVWVRGISAPKDFDRVSNFAQLSGKWNALVMVKPSNVYTENRAPIDSESPLNAPFGSCCVCGKGAWAMLHVRDYPLPFCPSQDEAHLTKQEVEP